MVNNGLSVQVAYGSAPDATGNYDKKFGQSVSWDIPLLEGYLHTILNSIAPPGSPSHQTRLFEPQSKAELPTTPSSAIWAHGWNDPYTRAAWKIAREKRIPLPLRGETSLPSVKGSFLRRLAHRCVFTLHFRQPAAFLAVGSLNKRLYPSYVDPDRKIFNVPFASDNPSLLTRFAQSPNSPRVHLPYPRSTPIYLLQQSHHQKTPRAHPPHIHRTSLTKLSLTTSRLTPSLVCVSDRNLSQHLERLPNRIAPSRVHFGGVLSSTYH